ncbi:MAG: hypothetical protein GY739_19515 [Mesoflavibacter sp.]|nr:hypothetical protein [Mesoflavibacter sp.]
MRRELAFPMYNELGEIYEEGMELRDYFASKALQGWMANQAFINNINEVDYAIHMAYKVADLMMIERDKFKKEANEKE